jgi:response regulator RpfG family c-di-GMP phosphodiesterase
VSGLATPKSKAADLLLRAQLLQKAQYERIVTMVRETNERAEDVLIENDIFSEAELLKALSGIYRTHFVSTEKLSKADIPRATVQMIPRRVAETLGVFPVLFDRQTSVLSVVTADPDNAEILREVKLVSGAKDVKAFVARPAAVVAAIKKHHAGDTRAFDLLERSFAFEFGQQVMPDGRVVAKKDSVRRNGTSDDEMPAPAAGRAPSVRRQQASQPDTDGLDMPPPPPVRARAVSQPDIGEPQPQRASRTTARRAELSAPPPPAAAAAAAAAAPIPAPARVPGAGRSDHADHAVQAPGSREPSNLTRVPHTVPPTSDLSSRASHNPFTNDTTIELLTVMVSLLENSRQELRGHSSQVARLLKRVAERMSLDRNDTYAVIVAGHIHDIGKMGQFHLTALNCSEYEGHRAAAQKAYDTPLRLLEAVRLPAAIKNAVFHMYERFDGKGFPDKLVGKEIPLGARLLAVADTYADLTQNPRNPFRKVLGPAEAMNVLVQHKGAIFDPGILDLFKALVLGEDMKAKLLANRYRVLVVDPDPEESTVLELRMVEQGFDVKTARTIDAARKALTADGAEFDLVVCEVEVPDADGLAFLSEARKEEWGRDMPWIVHTHKQGRTEAQRAFDLGAMDFVAKPVQADVLVAKLKAMLDQWSTKQGAKGVSGSLREMGLPDIVQVLFHGRKTGKLNIRSSGKTGEIHFLEGNIANAIIGAVTGTEAFYTMLKFDDGDFGLDPSFKPPKRIIEDSSEALLLEGMRRMDEGL